MLTVRTMLIMGAIICVAAPYPPIDPKLDSSWKRSVDRRGGGDWSLNIWHHTNGDELVVAISSKRNEFESEDEANEIKNFVIASNPRWIDQTRFAAAGNNGIRRPRFLKANTKDIEFQESNSLRILGAQAFSYVVVSENEKTPFMAVGKAIAVRNMTIVIQHNSKRPISDKLVESTLESLFEWPPLQVAGAKRD